MTPEQYCQNKAAGSGSSFYYSFLFLDPEERRAVTALYAFCREVDDVVDECQDPQLARIKLNWWREEIARVYEGTPQHPVGLALKAPCHTFALPLEQFQEIIDGMEMDLDRTSYETFKDLSLYCHRVAGVVGLLTAEIFGYSNRRTAKYAHDLGIAFQLTNILRDVREDWQRGRLYVPVDELRRFQVSEQDLGTPIATPQIRALFEYQAKRAFQYYQRAFTQLPEIDRFRQRSGIIMAEIYLNTLQEITNDGYRVLEHRIHLTPLHKLFLAWRVARREKRRWRRERRRWNQQSGTSTRTTG